MIKILLLFILLPFVLGATHFVPDDFNTIQSAVNAANPGDTINVRAGTYEGFEIRNSGTSGHYITIQTFQDDVVNLDPGWIAGWHASYVIVKGFHVKDTPGERPGIEFWGDGSHVEILDNEVTGVDNYNAAAIRIGGNMRDFRIDGNHVHHIGTGMQEGIRVMEHTSDFEITNNLVHDTSNIGIDVIGWAQFGKPVRGLISGNTVHDTGKEAEWSAGIYTDCASQITVENNIAYHNVRGFQMGCEEPGDISEGNIFRFNIAYENSKTGMQVGGHQGGMVIDGQVYNNVFYHNGDEEIAFDSTPGNGNEYYNNIFYDSDSTLIAHGGNGNTFDHNIYFDQDGPGTDNLVSDPQFVDAPNDFHVMIDDACSGGRDGGFVGVYPCKDCGIDVLLDYIDKWKTGVANMTDLLDAIAKWRSC